MKENTQSQLTSKNSKNLIDSIELPSDLVQVAKFLTAHPNIASKKWVYEQYDSMVGTINMGTNSPKDAAVVNIKGSNRALAMTVDCMLEWSMLTLKRGVQWRLQKRLVTLCVQEVFPRQLQIV